MTTPETTADMREFCTLMDTITGGLVSKDSLKACALYAVSLARAEAAELEAAREWRPVTEEPEEYNWYITVDDEAAAREDGTPPYAVQFYDGEWVGRVDGWRPIHTERPLLDTEPTP